MQIYMVGGAVRDQLLGLPVKDRDYVVVGATPEQLLAKGFKPVGKDFPVFLHPDTHEEYALARTERKTAPGYTGFVFHTSPDVTLEQDLARRDLTINAIALDDQGRLIDPFNGVADLRANILRHVSDAFVEDPVRILRLARFAARFGFQVAPETLALMQDMVSAGEVDALVPERVWQELAKGLMEARPSQMFLVLRDCGALARILPELDQLFGVPQPPAHHPEIDTGDHVMRVVDYAASEKAALAVRFAALMHDLGKGTTDPALWPRHHAHEERSVALVEVVCGRLKVPNDCRDLAKLVARHHGNVHRAKELRPGTILKLLQACDAFRKPDRFQQVLQACLADSRGRLGFETRDYPQAQWLSTAFMAAVAVNAGDIAAACIDKAMIPQRVAQARVEAIRHVLNVPIDETGETA
ncbi:multifunctional CCA addition/repair protein [Chitinivorax sp. B]|uniref:multifunctional CCA addition/repair protein n=1 Tax=Chitinivorax sp. B TaxID=2502235 RepID=UPI0010F5DF8C|nr:multifunctional CCA addition/repair protein [Chitinivorax sp. B]